MLREFFDGKVPNSGPSPDEAVAHGAALQAEGLAVEINAELAAANAARWADDAVLERVGALAAVMSKVGRGSEALALHERAVAANPKRPSAHVKLGSALGTAGRTAEAAGMFGRAVTLYGAAAAAAGHNPLEASGLGVFDALSKHALALAKLSRMPEALVAYDRALATEGTEELSDRARASVHGQRALALRALQVRAQARRLRFSYSAERPFGLCAAGAGGDGGGVRGAGAGPAAGHGGEDRGWGRPAVNMRASSLPPATFTLPLRNPRGHRTFIVSRLRAGPG